MKIKVKKDIGKHKPGDLVDIKTDDTGVPIDRFWRRRLADAEFDQCCEIVIKPSKPKSSKIKESKE